MQYGATGEKASVDTGVTALGNFCTVLAGAKDNLRSIAARLGACVDRAVGSPPTPEQSGGKLQAVPPKSYGGTCGSMEDELLEIDATISVLLSVTGKLESIL